MSMVRVESSISSPWPRHAGQGERISWPLPEQTGQVVAVTSWPSSDWRTVRCWPEPLQREQVVGSVPGLAPDPLQREQVVAARTRTSLEVPNTASVNGSRRRMPMVSPRRARERVRERPPNGSPPPKNWPSRSSKEAPKPENGSPPPPPSPSTPASP
jgi:hypothetical protein